MLGLKLKILVSFNSMFLLHCVDGGFTEASNPSGALDGQEGSVMKPDVCCPHTRTAEAISVSARKLIKFMFPLHVLSSTCKYSCFLEASRLEEHLEDNLKGKMQNGT